MKSIPYWVGALIMISLYACTPPVVTFQNNPYQQPQPQIDNTEVTDQTFYDDLTPDGRWINDPQIGYVWSPNVDANFRPYYTNGHWNYTDYGWTWVSDYRWGWAPFHYGRWKYDNAYGWVWAPGHEWGPAWVQWRKTPDSYGWAPLEPSISIEVGSSSNYHIAENHWAFIPQQHIADHNFRQYAPPVQQNNVYISKSTIINNNITNLHNTTINNNTTINKDNRKYVGGPNIHEVENITNQKVQVYNIHNGSKPGATTESNNAINIYRPQIRGNAESQEKNEPTAPKNVLPYRQNPAIIPNFHQQRPENNNQQSNNQQNAKPAQNQNNQPNAHNQYNQATQNVQLENQQPQPSRHRNNNITTQPVNPAVTPQKQDVPVLNPAENQHRAQGDVSPNNPNNNSLPRQQQPKNDKNEQTIPLQQQTPQPINRNPAQNSPFQQRQNPSTNPNNVPNTNQPVNPNEQQPFPNNQNNNQPNNPNYYRQPRTQPAQQQAPQQQPINKTNLPNTEMPAQNNRQPMQTQTRQNNNPVRLPATTPVTTPQQPKKEGAKPPQ